MGHEKGVNLSEITLCLLYDYARTGNRAIARRRPADRPAAAVVMPLTRRLRVADIADGSDAAIGRSPPGSPSSWHCRSLSDPELKLT